MILSVSDERTDSMKWIIDLLEWSLELNLDIGVNSINMNTGWLIMIYWIQANAICLTHKICDEYLIGLSGYVLIMKKRYKWSIVRSKVSRLIQCFRSVVSGSMLDLIRESCNVPTVSSIQFWLSKIIDISTNEHVLLVHSLIQYTKSLFHWIILSRSITISIDNYSICIFDLRVQNNISIFTILFNNLINVVFTLV